LNIYFSCSITGGRKDQRIYRFITDHLTASGLKVPTAHLANLNILDLEQVLSPEQTFLRDCQWLEECDALVAEASTPSHGVGYEIALALSLGKPVLCCYRKDVRVSKMLTGNTTTGFSLLAYSTDVELQKGLTTFLDWLILRKS
jgi:nucleoside 2-deoxyribosyltransferase